MNFFQILKNGELNRKLSKITFNFSIRIAGNVISKLLAVVTIPIIARALGPEAYGNYNLVIVILTYTGLAVNFGFTVYGIREVAQAEDLNELVSSIISARFSLCCFSILLSGLIVIFIFHNHAHLLIAIFLGFTMVVAQVFENDFYFFGKGNMVIPSVAQIIGRLVFTLGVFLFIKRSSHLVLLVSLYSLYYMIASGIGIFFLLKKVSFKISFSLKKAWQLLRKTYRLGISARLELVQGSFPIIVISALLGSFQLGIFSAAFRFFTIILLVYQTIMIALAPYLVKINRLNRETRFFYMNILLMGMILVGIFSAIFLITIGDSIIMLLFGKSFELSTPIFRLICLIVIPLTPISMLLGSFLIYMNQDKKYMVSTVVAAAVILVATPALVLLFSSKGAVWALGLSTLSSIMVSMYYLHRLFPGWVSFKSLRIRKRISS